MKRLLAAITLATTPLLAIASSAVAAPPQHATFSDCYDADEQGGLYCYTTDSVSKITDTSSGNQIEHLSTTNAYSLVWGTGSPYPNYTGVTTVVAKTVYLKGDELVSRFQQTQRLYVNGLTCVNTYYYKATNGKVQVEDFHGICT